MLRSWPGHRRNTQQPRCEYVPVVLLVFLLCSLRSRGSRLLVLRGTPQEVLPRVFKVR